MAEGIERLAEEAAAPQEAAPALAPHVLDAVATSLASGQSIAAVANLFSLRRREVEAVAMLPDVVELVEGKRERIMNAVAAVQAKILLNADGAIDNIVAKANNLEDRDSARCNMWLVERVVAPAPTKVEAEVKHTMDATLLASIDVGLKGLAERGFGQPETSVEVSPHLLSGAAVMEERDNVGTRKNVNGSGSGNGSGEGEV
jgi:hypothetical protein